MKKKNDEKENQPNDIKIQKDNKNIIQKDIIFKIKEIKNEESEKENFKN